MELAKIKSVLKCAVIASAMLATQQVVAQPDDEITVTGRYGRVPDSVQSLSQTVSYTDLDLSIAADRAELRHRLNLTARYLCDKLGESDTSDSIVPSCRDGAVRDAIDRIGSIEQHFAPRGTTWVRGTRWSAPYPSDWDTRYP